MDWETEDGMDGDEGEGMGAAEDDSTRYDPAVLYYRISTSDLRNDTTTTADGIPRPAIQTGRMTFLDVTPGVAGLTNWKEGGKSPYPFTGHRLAIRLFLPADTSDMLTRNPAGVGTIVPRGVQIAQFLARGLFSMFADTVPIFDKVPVDTIGAAGGMIVIGGADVATGQSMGTSRRDGFPLPDPIKLTTGGPSVTAWIEWAPTDLAYLGAGIAGVGVGAPLPTDIYAVDGVVPLVVATPTPPARMVVSLELWGRRGINIHAGASRKAGATAARRQATK